VSLPVVLVVDDDPVSVTVVGQVLKESAEVVFASNGPEALARATEESPDLILLDVLMPGIDGYEVCTELKRDQHTRDIPIIFISSLTDEGQEARGLLAGAIDYVTKPITPAILLARVRNHLDLKRHRDRLELESLRDGLTGLGNQRRLREVLDIEWRRAARAQAPLSLLAVEIDDFEAFAETYGPQAAQACLRRVALALDTGARRPADVVVRFLGDQCLVVLPDTDEAGARATAERMRAAVFALDIPHARTSGSQTVTVCIGATTERPTADGEPAGLISRAVERLHQAGNGGLNRCASDRDAAAETVRETDRRAQPAAKDQIRREHVFIVDDDPVSLATISEVVRRGGYDVESTTHSTEAVARITALRPDVVLLDVLMSDIDGIEICRRLKETPETAGIPVIFVSRVAETAEKVRALAMGGIDYVSKPFQPDEVLARVSTQVKMGRLQRDMREANTRLIELDRLKATFAAMLVHDLRSPLGTVQLTLSMLEDKLASNPDTDLRELVDLSLEGLKSTLALISEMLEVYRSEQGEAPLRKERLDLAELLRRCATVAGLEAERRGISFEAHIAGPLAIGGDPARLERAFANLLGNALKFTSQGGHVAIEARLVESHGRHRVRVEVRDTGSGIPHADIPYVFDLYRQAESRQRGAGVGLGLAIVKRILDAHGATIAVKSQVGVGSVFTVELPPLDQRD